MQINSRSFYLRLLIKKYINKEYLSWLKDSEVNQFLEVRFSPPTMKQANLIVALEEGFNVSFTLDEIIKMLNFKLIKIILKKKLNTRSRTK
tara:strand:+ start:26 stop:298 length:273 start_codon:yes stop_codon:yes gene_type:complete